MKRAYAAILTTFLVLLAAPSDAKPSKRPHGPTGATAETSDLAEQGKKFRRAQEAQERKWDAETAKMMKSICRGC